MKPPTFRTTLTLRYAGVLTLLLTVLGVAAYHALARQLDLDATAEVRELTRGVHGYLRFDGGTPVLEYDRNDPEQVAFVEEATRYYQVYDASTGRLLVQSSALEPLGLHYTPSEVRAFAHTPRTYDVQTDQRRIRLSTSLISPGQGTSYVLQVGVPLDQRDSALAGFLRLLLTSLPVALVVVVVLGRWMAARGLAPLVRLAAATRAIGVDDLHRRLPAGGSGDELDEVAHAFNDVLGRLQHAVGEMRQFSAAMAHELRTPLAAIRGEIELALMRVRSPDEYQGALVSQLEELDKLARLITDLLTLARAESGEILLARAPLDLAALGSSVAGELEAVAAAKDIAVSCEVSGDVWVTGDAAWMQRLLLNLIDNAIKFTPEGGRISVSVAREGDVAWLEVRDTGIGIPPEALAHVFERFYRVDAARSPRPEGAGLGLSLAKWIADRHGATIDVASRLGEGTTMTLRMPRLAARGDVSRAAEGGASAPPTR